MRINKLAETYLIGYPDYSYPLGIILNDEEGYNWLYENFVNLYFDEKNIKNPLRFFYSNNNFSLWNTDFPFLNYDKLSLDTFISLTNYHEIIRKTIDDMGYILLNLNEFFVPNRMAFRKYTYNHTNLIYGYENNTYLIIGYDKNMQYNKSSISLTDFDQSITNTTPTNDQLKQIYIIKKENTIRWDFSKERLLEKIKSYLESENRTISIGNYLYKFDNLKLGISVYEKLIDYYKYIHNNNCKHNFIKPLRVLYEHKRLFKDRFNFLGEVECYNKFLLIEKKVDELITKIIYYRRKGSDKIINEICTELNIIKKMEITILDSFLNMNCFLN